MGGTGTATDADSITHEWWYSVDPWSDTSSGTEGATWVMPVPAERPPDILTLPGRLSHAIVTRPTGTAPKKRHINRRGHSRGRGGWCGHTRRRP
jgi:hypothetical protein